MEPLNLDWQQLLGYLLYLLAAFVLTLPMAWDRERHSRSMGLRTFPIVGVASTAFVLIARVSFGDDPDAQARIIQGLMTGIGFIGGGAILKGDGNVSGTATAASIWATGAIGAAAAYGRFEIAILVSLVNYALLRLLTPMKAHMIEDDADED
ncbi:MAG TPA: MgtC/SapB family protein [Candidatus Sulfomarinibacteraceae bacterium]|nr:MgtC/SapB family protein [Candidatus Sulfomarinibacteraceae bacterium]